MACRIPISNGRNSSNARLSDTPCAIVMLAIFLSAVLASTGRADIATQPFRTYAQNTCAFVLCVGRHQRLATDAVLRCRCPFADVAQGRESNRCPVHSGSAERDRRCPSLRRRRTSAFVHGPAGPRIADRSTSVQRVHFHRRFRGYRSRKTRISVG